MLSLSNLDKPLKTLINSGKYKSESRDQHEDKNNRHDFLGFLDQVTLISFFKSATSSTYLLELLVRLNETNTVLQYMTLL